MSTILKSFLIVCFSFTHGLFAAEIQPQDFLKRAFNHYNSKPQDVVSFFQENGLNTQADLRYENNQFFVKGEKGVHVVMESITEKEIIFKVNGHKVSVLPFDNYQDIAVKIKPFLEQQSAFIDFLIPKAHAVSGAAVLVAVAAIIGIAAFMAYSSFKKSETVELINLTQEVCMDGAEAVNRTFTETEMVLAVKRYNELSDINKKHCQMKTTKGVDPKIIQACQSLKQSKKCLKENVEVIDNSARGANKTKASAVYIPSADRFKEMTLSK